MDEKTNLITEFSLVQVTEVTSSNIMEYEGCKRTLNSIIKKKIPIRCLTTEGHTTITAKMRTNYSNIVHQYDVWHLSKWVTKNLSKNAEKKDCQDRVTAMDPECFQPFMVVLCNMRAECRYPKGEVVVLVASHHW
jgi:hypothetical protein